MLFALLPFSLSFPLEGRWIGKFTTSLNQELNFSITFKLVGTLAELRVTRKKRGMWYRYELQQRRRTFLFGDLNGHVIVAVGIVLAVAVYCCVHARKKNANKKKE
jgi:hypothetical protein